MTYVSIKSKIREKIREIALLNALSHKGKCMQGPVIGKLLAEMPDLKAKIRQVESIVKEVASEVNSLSYESQKIIVQNNWPEASKRKKPREKKKLPQLPNVTKYKQVVTRFSPNPDAPIHLGSARAIILCKEYANIYDGKFLVRFEDTDPKLKKPQLQFYDFIKEDLKWLNSEADEYFIQSDRLPIYYKHTEVLLKQGSAYVCTCSPEQFRKKILVRKPCPCRSLNANEHIERWKKMLNGFYKEGEAVVRVKTDLSHPNPAVRDWPALRIIDTKVNPHPRVGRKYCVWPLYNLACGIDDHLMGVTHIIRGKEHLTNQTRQEFMYRYFGWKYPEAIHYGRMRITGATLSKSKIVEGVRDGTYTNWDDPRLATFMALRRRGITAEAIRRLILDVGPKAQDISLSWENLYAHNRRIVEPEANRYFFVNEPQELTVRKIPKRYEAKIALHPDHPERGFRKFKIIPENGEAEFWVTKRDLEKIEENRMVRFMELFNITTEDSSRGVTEAIFHSEGYEEAKKTRAPLIHWLPKEAKLKCQVILPNNSLASGLAEESCRELQVGMIVQFERFGFARMDNRKANLVTAYYCHR